MGYKYETINENSDATTSYNILGNFPVKFETFFWEILENSNSFRIEFGASNEEFGGWLGNRLEVSKDLKTNRCYWSRQNPDGWYEQIKDLEITKCWANGGWGQMSYIVTFATDTNGKIKHNEDLGVLEERRRQYITVECETEEDFKELKAAVEHYHKEAAWLIDGDWAECSHCHESEKIQALTHRDYCPACGARMVIK